MKLGLSRAANVAQKRLVAAAGAASALLMISGCATIPTNSGVNAGSDISSVTTSDFIYFSPYEPPKDGSIGDIMTGFLSAGTGPQNDYAVARLYLANSLKSTWMPGQQVVVTDSTPEVLVDEPSNTAKVVLHVSAYVDKGGRLTINKNTANSTYEYSFIKENGQYRISAAPNLTIVSRPVFDVVFNNYALYFYDSQKHYLVPDVRWYPTRATTATRLVNALIAGPDEWVSGAVANVIPAGTKLAIDAVTITDGVASVDFNSKVLSASPVAKAQIKAQLNATLTQISGVTSVQISVDRNSQSFGTISPWDIPVVSLTPVVLTKDSLAHLSGNSITPIDGTKTLVQQLKPKDFAITSQNNWVAVTTAEGLYQASLLSFGVEPRLVDTRTNLLPPVFDRQGWLWSINDAVGPRLKFFDQSQNSGEILSPELSNKRILSYSVSPEGARLAAVLEVGKAKQIWLFGIVRSSKGLPIKLSPGKEISTEALNPLQVSWLDGSRLGILSKNASGWSVPSQLTIGGFENNLTGLSEAEAFIGSQSTSSLFALTKYGDLMQFRSSSWSRVQSDILKVHYPN